MKDSLFSNKLAAAILIVLLLFFGLPVITKTFSELASGHHGEHYEEGNPFGLTYQPYAELVGVSSAGEEEVAEVSLGCLLAEASAERGARSAAICQSCHSFNEGGANGTGPNLWNVLGRDIASVSGYSYTGALQALEGDWTYDKLDQYLYDSQGYVSGTQMAQKIRKDGKRSDILAYLGTLTGGDPAAYPECAPPAEEAVAQAEETPEEEAAAEAADRVDFEVPESGGANTLPDEIVNNRGDDGYPSDPEQETNLRSSSDESVPEDNTQDVQGPSDLPEDDTDEEIDQAGNEPD